MITLRLSAHDIKFMVFLFLFIGTTDIIYSLVWSQDSGLLASSGLDSAVRLWDVNLLNSKRIEEMQLSK